MSDVPADLARLSPAEQDYYIRGMTTWRAVNAMAWAAEQAGRGYAQWWSAFDHVEWFGEWDNIARLPFQ